MMMMMFDQSATAPKPPTSVYNLFFHLEFRRILESGTLDGNAYTIGDIARFRRNQDSQWISEDEFQVMFQKREFSSTKMKDFKFDELSNHISKRWKTMSAKEQSLFYGYYDVEVDRCNRAISAKFDVGVTKMSARGEGGRLTKTPSRNSANKRQRNVTNNLSSKRFKTIACYENKVYSSHPIGTFHQHSKNTVRANTTAATSVAPQTVAPTISSSSSVTSCSSSNRVSPQTTGISCHQQQQLSVNLIEHAKQQHHQIDGSCIVFSVPQSSQVVQHEQQQQSASKTKRMKLDQLNRVLELQEQVMYQLSTMEEQRRKNINMLSSNLQEQQQQQQYHQDCYAADPLPMDDAFLLEDPLFSYFTPNQPLDAVDMNFLSDLF